MIQEAEALLKRFHAQQVEFVIRANEAMGRELDRLAVRQLRAIKERNEQRKG